MARASVKVKASVTALAKPLLLDLLLVLVMAMHQASVMVKTWADVENLAVVAHILVL